MTVTKVKGGDDLAKESSGFLRSQPSFLDEVVKQFTSTHVLQHEIQVFPVLVHVVKTQDILVLYQLHDGNLPLDLLQHRLAELLLVDDLDGHLLPQHTMGPQLDQSCNKRKSSKIFSNFRSLLIVIFKGFYIVSSY